MSVRTPSPDSGRLAATVRALRPRQWPKNVLVFAAPVAAGSIDEWSVARNSLFAFVAFCLAASGTYLLNDAQDVESDRQHPTKRNRPIAAGIVPVPLAYALVEGLEPVIRNRPKATQFPGRQCRPPRPTSTTGSSLQTV